jgi:DNA-binding NarL/FixJ family response regulator
MVGPAKPKIDARSRILAIVGDDITFERWERLLMGRAQLLRAKTLDAAWRQTEESRWTATPCEFALVDIDLPDGNGGDVLDRLTALTPAVTIGVVFGTIDARQALSLHGRCALVVPRPLDRDALFKMIDVLSIARRRTSPIDSFAEVYGLSPQETRLLRAAAADATNDDAAAVLGCTPSTVRSYWSRIFDKTKCRSARAVFGLLVKFVAECRYAEPSLAGPVIPGASPVGATLAVRRRGAA